MSAATAPATLLDGPQLRDAFASATRHLREMAKAIDAINVYPVPDGDTGSNMAATMREAVDATLVIEEPVTVAGVLAALAKGALYGARGNSGVIFSQALRGLARGVGDRACLDAAALADGLVEAASAAYGAVSKPVEGTMLTVMRAAGEAARAGAAELPGSGEGHPCVGLLDRVVRASETTEAATIDQLPALKEAGVPDAGGEGVCVILRGLLGAITGTAPVEREIPHRPIAMMAGHERGTFGYCTEFMIEAVEAPLPVAAVRELAQAGRNTSVVIVGDEQALRVHVHTEAPQALIDGAGAYGKVDRAKVEDMSVQNVRWIDTGSGASARVALLALSRGQGFDAVFRSLGAHVADLGYVEKPPAGEIAAAAEALGVPDVIVLPNHRNVVMAAEQAATLTRCTLHVVPTASLPQGVAAALAFDSDESVRTNLAAMDRAGATVGTVEVTIAAADRTAEGVTVTRGEAIAIVDGRLVASAPDPVAALLLGLERAARPGVSLVTVYGGADVSTEDLQQAAHEARERYHGIEVETVTGGQPLYPFIASVE